jgi:DNA-binding transcriptional MocR family regulator
MITPTAAGSARPSAPITQALNPARPPAGPAPAPHPPAVPAAARRAVRRAGQARAAAHPCRHPGLHAVATLPRGWDDRELARRAETASVRVYPMSDYRARAAREPAVVLGYAALTPTEIDAGVQALAGACLRPPLS